MEQIVEAGTSVEQKEALFLLQGIWQGKYLVGRIEGIEECPYIPVFLFNGLDPEELAAVNFRKLISAQRGAQTQPGEVIIAKTWTWDGDFRDCQDAIVYLQNALESYTIRVGIHPILELVYDSLGHDRHVEVPSGEPEGNAPRADTSGDSTGPATVGEGSEGGLVVANTAGAIAVTTRK